MALDAQFYVDGPYLHKNPSLEKLYTGLVTDNFQSDFYFVNNSIKKSDAFQKAVDSLKARADQAKTYEDQFLGMLNNGIPISTEEFSAKYMIASKLKDYKKAREKYLSSGSVSQKIEIILRNPRYYESFVPDMETVDKNLSERLDALFQEDSVKIIKEYSEIAGGLDTAHEVSDFLVQNFVDMFPNKVVIDKNFRLTLKGKELFKDRQIEESFKRKLRAAYKDSKDSFMSPRKVEAVRKAFIKEFKGRDLQRLIKNVSQSIRNALMKNLLNSDFPNGEKEKIFYVNYITSEVRKFLREKVVEDKGVFYLNISNTLGDWDEFTREMSFTPLFNQLDFSGMAAEFSERIVRRIGREHVKVSSAPGSQPAGQDLQIGDFLFQLKATKTDVPGLGGTSSDYLIDRSPNTLVALVNEAAQSGVNIPDLDELKYVLVNKIHRGETDLISLAQFLINIAVEIYIRSDTVKSLLNTDATNFPMPGKPVGGFLDQKVPQNHFWIINNKLIGVSSFLYSSYYALQQISDVPAWHGGGSFFTCDISIVESILLQEKRKAMKKSSYTPGGPYGDAVLAVGREQGETIYAHIGLKQVRMLREFSNALQKIPQ